MTFTPNVPVATQSPSQFPPQNGTNFTRVKANFDTEHVFEDTAPMDATSQGVHRQMTMIARLTPVSLPAGTNGIYYAKTIGGKTLPFYWDGTSEYALAPVRASATWDSTGTIQPGGSAFNTTVSLFSPGVFDITFTVAIPTIYPQFFLTCVNASTIPAWPVILSINQVGSTLKGMRVQFNTANLTPITGFTQANIMVFGG